MAPRPLIRVPRAMMARKPAHGAPCTRCGVCCVATLCDLGRHFFGPLSGPCPALIVDKDDGVTTACALVMAGDQEHREAAALLIARGDGCDARFNGEPVNRAFHAYQAQKDVDLAEEIRAARGPLGDASGLTS